MIVAVGATLAASCGSGSKPSSTQSFNDNPDPATARAWVSKWCAGELRSGMTAAQLRAVMGPPSSTYPYGSKHPEQISWSAYQYSFTAFMNADGRARHVQDDVGRARC